MNMISEILTHFWSGLGVALTLYCYVVIRKSRFVFVTESKLDVINMPDNVEVKFDHVEISSNIKYYKVLICYTGVSDIKEEDVIIPLTIKNNAKGSRFHRVKILETSRTFNPVLRWHQGELQISSPTIKVGDSILLQFYLESSEIAPYFYQRMHNVEVKSKIHYNEGKSLGHATSFFLSFLITAFILIVINNTYNSRHIFEDEYHVVYEYRGYKISEDSSYEASHTADSLYMDNFRQNFQLMDKKLDSLARIGDMEQKMNIIHANYREFGRFIAFEDSVIKNKPSTLAEALFQLAKKKGNIPYSKTIKINNELKITLLNPREDSWTYIILTGLFVFFVSIVSIFCLFRAAFYTIEYLSIRRAFKYLKQ